MSQQNLAQERRDIVAKYDRGREDNSKIDPWEDPQYEVYHRTDRYGFIHDQRLPTISGNDNKKMIETEMGRVEKWLKMIEKWDANAATDKFRKRIYKGVPNKVRIEVWKRLLKIDAIKLEQEGVYKKMRDLARLHSPEIRQIDLDVNRTYRNHEMFRERYGVKQQALFHVLAAYSMYNTEVGYCQGMSQVAALLLMYMSDEDAFWGLSALLSDRKYAMHGFFIPGFPKLQRFQTLHESILKKHLPKVKKHIDKHDIHTNLYSVKWFFQCFLDRVPFHLCLRLWDIYLYEGERLLIAMAYNVFKMHQRTILKRKSMETVIDLLQKELEHDFGYTDDEVIFKLGECMDELRRHRLDLPDNVENELPTKPFGLLYHPTVGQVRRFVDTTILTERNSLASSDDTSSKLSNGHSISPQFVSAGTQPVGETKLRHVSEERLAARPSSRQTYSSHAPSVYDNVVESQSSSSSSTGRGNNRVRPVTERPSSPVMGAMVAPLSLSSPDANSRQYVSVVQVTASSSAPTDQVRRSGSVIEKTEMFTKEYVVGPARSPVSPPAGLPKVTTSQILLQRDGLKSTGGGGGSGGGGGGGGVTRYGTGSHDHGQHQTGGSRISRLDQPLNGTGKTSSNGGATVIRIGM